MKKQAYLLLFVLVNATLVNAQKAVKLDLNGAINKSEKVVYLSEIASDIQYIPLETTDECLIGSEFDIRYTGNDIIISCSQNLAFYHFNKDGKFMNQIGKKGQGPGEYNVGLFYFLDYDKSLFYTHDWNDIFCYDYNGKFISKIKSPDLNMGVAEKYGKDMIIYSNDTYFHKKKNGETSYQLYIVDLNGKSEQKFRGKVEEGKRYGVNLTTRDYMYVYNGESYFKGALENIVYRISNKKKIPVWEFDSGKKSVDVTSNEIDPSKRFKSISVFRLKETDKYLFVQYGIENKQYIGMYDKASNLFQNVRLVDDLSGGIDFIPFAKCIDGYLACGWVPKAFKSLKKHGNAKLKERENEFNSAASLSDEDNPVMVVAKLK